MASADIVHILIPNLSLSGFYLTDKHSLQSLWTSESLSSHKTMFDGVK